ncbi:hemerythrin-like domain-containing protein [Actinoalloteichus hoggarensis]|uniref:Hemerythrin HHE cation binding domain protein n=1 Tax=Actinoalloteichus hoggarensis TaxID=1470176 RepID=A0A221W979_9PSEU|nr:hemerythrin domain-containing protein [Actinoalloteichus hoggarensis]ASO22059.1 Hemerythrin HHE cation binding domain protein [Actinoalloteichus hoggarensis]MBB5923859.1 hemerythrin-like domain-containing protein [Actinoalloteichus hoggarensis]
MAEGEKARLRAWSHEMRTVHRRLREALSVTRDAVWEGEGDAATRDLLVFCRGFCTALNGHHEGEDRSLFPAIEAAHPELRETLRLLTQDHSMISYLLDGLREAADRAASAQEIDRHLEGIAAIMENHFRYEERMLLSVLETLELAADPRDVLGPL